MTTTCTCATELCTNCRPSYEEWSDSLPALIPTEPTSKENETHDACHSETISDFTPRPAARKLLQPVQS